MSNFDIPFNKPFMTGNELKFISEAYANGILAGDGPFTERCQKWIVDNTHCLKALLTHSCTAALEMSGLILDLKEGDEVILPSYTFVSTANAFVLRGVTPVFVDIRADTLNLDETRLEEAVTKRTKAVIPVHYAGVGCEMDSIMQIAKANKLAVVEDAAQAVMSKYKGRDLGSIGDFGTYSFHETKNLISGEGGALLINSEEHILKAEIVWEKGTDRTQFFRGEVDKYSWREAGSSFLPGEVVAAFLWAQLEQAREITDARLVSWNHYHQGLAQLENEGRLRRPIVPDECNHNAHMYYILLPESVDRSSILSELKSSGIHSVFHYVPLHSSTAGRRFGRTSGSLPITDNIAERLVRLPLWNGLTCAQQDKVMERLAHLLK